jgi:hypothetical protein
VVISFLQDAQGMGGDFWYGYWTRQMQGQPIELPFDVAISTVGAGGERSEMEGADP